MGGHANGTEEIILDKRREEHIQHVFDGFCKRVLKNAANDYYDEIIRRSKHEVLLADCWNLPHTIDEYVLESAVYTVLGEDIRFTNSALINALDSLSEENRTIILATCVMGLPDREIAEHLKVVRRTLTYRKAKLLQELRRVLSDV